LALPHARGIVHQDLKPGNIIIDESGDPRVIDFGLARLLPAWDEESDDAPGSISGTVQYMPPEQARGETENIDPRSDIFALGAVFYFLLVGRAPFVDDSVMASLDRARRCDFDREALRRVGVPRALEAVCLRAMQAEPDARYASVEAMACDLEQAAAGPRCLKRVVGAVLATVAVAAVAFGLWNLRGDGSQPPVPAPITQGGESSQVQKIEPTEMALEVLKRPLRNDFPIEFEVIGHPAGEDNTVTMIDGEKAAFRLKSDRECFVGIWHLEIVDGKTVVTRLFPNRLELDHLLAAGEPRTIPGDSEFRIPVSVSTAPEYLHVVAFSERWHAPSEPEDGPVTPEQLIDWRPPVKSAKVEEDKSPPIAEQLVGLHVRPKPQAGDSEAAEE
jgi:serine/threonine protein kinase